MQGNIFAVLDSKTKSKSKPSGGGSKPKKSAGGNDKKSHAEATAELERAIFAAPGLGTSNWADDDTDDEEQDHAPVDDGWSRVPAGVRPVNAAREPHLKAKPWPHAWRLDLFNIAALPQAGAPAPMMMEGEAHADEHSVRLMRRIARWLVLFLLQGMHA